MRHLISLDGLDHPGQFCPLLCLIVPRCIQDNLSAGVAGVTQGDYRMDGKMELITATTDGESKQSHRS